MARKKTARKKRTRKRPERQRDPWQAEAEWHLWRAAKALEAAMNNDFEDAILVTGDIQEFLRRTNDKRKETDHERSIG